MRRAGRLTVYSLLLTGSLPAVHAEELPRVLQVIPVSQPVPAELATPPASGQNSFGPEEGIQPLPENSAPSLQGVPGTTPMTVLATETIRERYPDGKVRIEREVVLDHKRNYVNHGSWKMFTPEEKLLGSGTYVNGKATGKWVRYYLPDGDDKLTGDIYKDFTRPFTSEATFVEDRLHGSWTITDDEGRIIRTWEFQNDRPHGVATVWRADGSRHSEVIFQNGLIDGTASYWPTDDTLVREEEWIRGRKLEPKQRKYHKGKKVSEGRILRAVDRKASDYDWWEGEVIPVALERPAEDSLHGPWIWWHSNGQKKREGTFLAGNPVGVHTEWYSTGQKKVVGEHANNKRAGHWTWWHPNGMKQLEGDYINGQQVGQWTSWSEEGKSLGSVAYSTPAFSGEMLQGAGPEGVVYVGNPLPGQPIGEVVYPDGQLIPGQNGGTVIYQDGQIIAEDGTVISPTTLPGPVVEQPRASGLLMSLPFFRNRR